MSKPEADPVCSPQVSRPLRVRALRYAAVVLATAGLVLLFLYSIHRAIPIVRVADIKPTMNFASVRIVGEVARDTTIFDSGGLVFNVKDKSGEIAVLGGRSQADALRDCGKLPRRGDHVEVAGSLSVSADHQVKLRLQSADQLVLQRKSTVRSAPRRIRLTDLTAAQAGNVVSVVGTLQTITIPQPGSRAPYVLMLEDDGGELPVVFWGAVFRDFGGKLPVPGKRIRAGGRIDVYKGTLQLTVRQAGDLRVVNDHAARRGPVERAVSRIGDLSASQKGKLFTVVGVLGEPRSIRGGVIYPIRDDSGRLQVLFWDKQVSADQRNTIASGVTLRVTAPLEVYNGVPELIPADADAFCVELTE